MYTETSKDISHKTSSEHNDVDNMDNIKENTIWKSLIYHDRYIIVTGLSHVGTLVKVRYKILNEHYERQFFTYLVDFLGGYQYVQ